MKRRQHELEERIGDEEQEARELAGLLSGKGEPSRAPSAEYWSRLIVLTNQRIDEVTSGKAISISWAVRVALPGVIAIVFFFIGLHYYYTPATTGGGSSLTSVLASLPSRDLDSLLADPDRLETSLTGINVRQDIFLPSSEQISEYLVVNGDASSVLDEMSEEQVREVVNSLGTVKSNQH